MAKCLVVPRTALEALPFWRKLGNTGAIRLQNNELSLLTEVIEREKRFLDREGKDDVEHKPEWQQIILYALVLRGEEFFVYKRGDKNSSYKEGRLYSKISAGVGGHIEPFDSSLIASVRREFSEELVFLLNGKEIPLPSKVEIIGVIKDDTDEVNSVHLGLACVVWLSNPGIEIQIKGNENAECWMTPIENYNRLENNCQYDIEGWTKLLMKMFLAQQKTA